MKRMAIFVSFVPSWFSALRAKCLTAAPPRCEIYSLTLKVPIVPVASAKALKSNSWIS